MNTSQLPSVRTQRSHDAAECSACGAREFDTQFGRGSIFWWGGVGSALRLDDPAEGPRLDRTVRCAACGANHAPRIELPPLENETESARAQR
jgi:ribosomal protein L37E